MKFEDLKLQEKVNGTVVKITEDSITVDLDGTYGIIPIEDIRLNPGLKPEDLFIPGQEVSGKVMECNSVTEEALLNIDEFLENQWKWFENTYSVDDEIMVRVMNIYDFGITVQIVPGITGLIHSTELNSYKASSSENINLEPGTKIIAKIRNILNTYKRVSLGLTDKSLKDQKHSDSPNYKIKLKSASKPYKKNQDKAYGVVYLDQDTDMNSGQFYSKPRRRRRYSWRFSDSKEQSDLQGSEEISSESSWDGTINLGHAFRKNFDSIFKKLNSTNKVGQEIESSENDEAVTDKVALKISDVQFSVITPKEMQPDDYLMIDIVMYEDDFREVVEALKNESEEPVQEIKSGVFKVEEKSNVYIRLSSPDLDYSENSEVRDWNGGYQSSHSHPFLL